jgi:hypothetical protein
MNKSNCRVSRKIKKKDIKMVSRNKIGNLIKTSKTFLNIVCPNSGVCIAFGDHTKELNNFFKGFIDFNYAVSPINPLGEDSNNGFVKEIEYQRQGYKSHVILKSALNRSADNLVYEYLVGIKFINRILKNFPCFIETYGLYFYDSISDWDAMKESIPIDKSFLNKLTLQNNIDYIKACKKSKFAAVLIQHIQNAKSLKKMISSEFFKNDLLYVLFIVYQALASLSKKFTHYDLHDGNVLVYEPVPGKFIEYHYHNKDGSITSFYSKYLPKIIDYGRSFFDNGNLNSKKIYDKICSIPECNPNCGENSGFSWLDPNPYLTISSSKKNESHDLRILNNMKSYFEKIKSPKPTEKIFIETEKLTEKIVYGIGIDDPKKKIYGSVEDLKILPNKIYNVNGAYIELKKLIEKPEIISENRNNYSNMTNKIGDLHIYHDETSMKYIHS